MTRTQPLGAGCGSPSAASSKQFRHDLVCVLLDRYGSGQTIFTVEELAAAIETDARDIETAMGRLERYGPLSVLRLSHGPADDLRWRVRP